MLRIAGQTAVPIGLKFLRTLMGGLGCHRQKKFEIFSSKFFFLFFHGQRRALQLVHHKYLSVKAQQSCYTRCLFTNTALNAGHNLQYNYSITCNLLLR